jgi:hypothetical protein
MESLVKGLRSRQRGAALIIVLAFVVLFTGLAVAYLSRTTSDRQIAHSSFNQSNVDQLVQSAVDNIIGDLRQEITNGSTGVTQADGTTLYTPTTAANMVPQRSGNAAGAANLIRRSVNPDSLTGNPGVPSRASAVNSTTDPSLNSRSVTLARWNTHYLLPKANTLSEDSYPPSPLLTPFNPYSPDPNGFTPPDWVFVTREFGADALSNPNTDSNGRPVTPIGRYSFAIYAEGGLLDMNVAGYPTDLSAAPIPAQRVGRKGSIAYADLTALGAYPILNPDTATNPPAYDVDRIVGLRNYASTQPINNFPSVGPPANQAFAYNFHDPTANPTPAALFYSYVLNNTNGFLSPNTATWNGRTDQVFLQRQQLIAFRKTIGRSTSFSANTLQYLNTFSRETNAPSFSPSTPVGSSIDYAALASTPDAVNPNFLLRRVTTSFTRFDGTTAVVGEPLVKTRFPLSRLAWISYKGPSALRTLPPQSPTLPPTDPNYDMWALQWLYGVPASYLKAGTAANIQTSFGLTFGVNAGDPWTYSHGAANRILRLDEVAAAGREPDFFELLQAGILSGSLGENTGGGVTGQNDATTGAGLVFPDIHMSNSTHHILSIGAAIIDQADPDSIPTRIQFNPSGTLWTAYGVENLPYITQMYPIAGTSPDNPNQWATYLTFQLWNPHQNIPSPYPASVRLRVDGAIGMFTGGNGEKWTGANPQVLYTTAGQSVILKPAFSFSAPAPLANSNTTNAAPAPGPAAGGTFAVLAAPPVP